MSGSRPIALTNTFECIIVHRGRSQSQPMETGINLMTLIFAKVKTLSFSLSLSLSLCLFVQWITQHSRVSIREEKRIRQLK